MSWSSVVISSWMLIVSPLRDAIAAAFRLCFR